MRLSIVLWIIAAALTLASARWQRVSGPTWPVSGRVDVGGVHVGYVLERTHAGADAHLVRLAAPEDVTGRVEWRPLGGDRAWTDVAMVHTGGQLVAELPGQASGRKLEYRVWLERGATRVALPSESGGIPIRFRGHVPAWVLLPHIVVMFLAMLFSTRAGLEGLRREPRLRRLADGTVALLFVGGIVLGCLVSWYAFRIPWGAVPFGWDVTDNKTQLALIAWIAAAIALRRTRGGRTWAIAAALVTLVVFAIPHSV
jgi:hypothetical protein